MSVPLFDEILDLYRTYPMTLIGIVIALAAIAVELLIAARATQSVRALGLNLAVCFVLVSMVVTSAYDYDRKLLNRAASDPGGASTGPE